MKKLFLLVAAFTLFALDASAQTKKDGTPDMRYRANKEAYGNTYSTPAPSYSAPAPSYSAPAPSYSAPTSSGPNYGGGVHTESHGGTYVGGSTGSSHKGGTYVNPNTNNQYGTHQL